MIHTTNIGITYKQGKSKVCKYEQISSDSKSSSNIHDCMCRFKIAKQFLIAARKSNSPMSVNTIQFA